MKAKGGEFIDTNVLVYAFSNDPRREVAEHLLAKGCLVSLQGLNEFANVARRKLGMSWDEIRGSLDAIRTLCPKILPMEHATQDEALIVAQRYGLSFFDALMIASALHAECVTFWSEDMQAGQIINDRLRIENPFL